MNTDFETRHGWPHKPVLGVDEAGRGPWAGPVVAAAVLLPPDYASDYAGGVLADLNDSKKLSAKKREALFTALQNLPHGIGTACVAEIDQLNILHASFLAMRRAVQALEKTHALTPAFILVDGNRLPDWSYAAKAVVRGDGRSPSIAAASVLAKVTRDRIMQKLAADWPDYGWAQNMGYGTKAHRAALARLGATPHHRTSFAPVRRRLAQDMGVGMAVGDSI